MLRFACAGALLACVLDLATTTGAQTSPAWPGPVSPHYRVWVDGREIVVCDESWLGFHTAACTVSGSATVEVELPETVADAPVVRPRRHGINTAVRGRTARFTLPGPCNLVLEAEGLPPLALFATPPECDVPRKDDPQVLYFPPGEHEPGVIRPQTGQTIYLAAGALVRGRIEAHGVADVRVCGRGIIDTRGYSKREDKTPGMLFEKSRRIRMEGIGVRGGSWWQILFLLSDDIEVAHMNIMGVSVNTDGIDIDGVQNFVARDCFIRCEDDGFGWHALDARRNGEPPTLNCLAEDCVIWNTRYGNGLRIGSSMETQLFRDITFRRIDVLEHAGAAIRSDHSDWAVCENIRFEDFVDESPGPVIEIVIAPTRYSNDNGYRNARGRFHGLHFTRVTSVAGDVILQGYDAEHAIDRVFFESCSIGGQPIDNLDDITVNEFVFNVSFANP